ncbi:serralysin family metalloprotease [Serratia marcescens]|uniref:serralysin family metalloprotease n=1 Tax=Serratia marcescens TaxID=615 RepID=UPI001D8A030F|nr:serralysin family metalloprotease [Serratia marcescens]CAF2531985.1 Serralysin C [Serratia marcescens]CAH5260973.1 Serralysin C [Serratia marcescens]
MSSRHNDILQDDDEFTSLAATSPNDHNYQFYYHQPGSLYDGLGYGALFTLDNANLYSNQRGGAAINNLGKIRDNFSFDRAADQLTRPGLTHNGDQVYHQPVALTYSFLTQSALNRIGQTGDGDKGLQPLTQVAQAQALKSMQAWADVANVTFTETASTDINHRADITFAYFTQRADGSTAEGSGPNAINAYAYYPPSSKAGSDNAFAGTVWFNKNFATHQAPVSGDFSSQTFTHELGHALGLAHPGSYDASLGNPSYQNDAAYYQDSLQYSIMSYFNAGYTGADTKGVYGYGPMVDDIAAIQKLYGANMNTRTGDTVYGFNSNTGRDFLTATADNGKPVNFAVWDAGGNDTLDFSGYSQQQMINLNDGAFSSVGGGTQNVAIARGAIIENAIGGSGRDVIIGNDQDNLLAGNAGSDILYGGLGADHLWGGKDANNFTDYFVYLNAKESTVAAFDVIEDFEHGIDKIDLSGLRFNNSLSELRFIDSGSAFSGQKGEIQLNFDAFNGTTDLLMNTQSNSYAADFKIHVVGQVEQSDILFA